MSNALYYKKHYANEKLISSFCISNYEVVDLACLLAYCYQLFKNFLRNDEISQVTCDM